MAKILSHVKYKLDRNLESIKMEVVCIPTGQTGGAEDGNYVTLSSAAHSHLYHAVHPALPFPSCICLLIDAKAQPLSVPELILASQ